MPMIEEFTERDNFHKIDLICINFQLARHAFRNRFCNCFIIELELGSIPPYNFDCEPQVLGHNEPCPVTL